MDGSLESPYTGILIRLQLEPPRPHDPDLRICSAAIAPWGPRTGELLVGGAGLDDEAALAACIGEAVERWQPYPLPDDQLLESSFEEWPLEEPAVEPERWVLYHDEQYARPGFPFRPFTRSSRCAWACFRQSPSGEPVWVPEELAFLHRRPGERHAICPGVSTGLACGPAAEAALLRGLQEVIERDAVVGAWWGSYPLEEWIGSDVLETLGDLAARLLRSRLRCRFYRAGSPFSAHVCLVTVEGEEERGFCLGIGSACRETRRESWLKAAIEAAHGYRYVRRLRETLADEERRQVERLEDFSHHALYYSLHPGRLGETALCRAAAPASDAGALAERREGLAELSERLGAGRPVLFRIMTPPAIAGDAGGPCVLKVLVPGLQPLHGSHDLAHLGGPLWRPRGLAAWRSMPPHPFP